jgi:hypothetical protein
MAAFDSFGWLDIGPTGQNGYPLSPGSFILPHIVVGTITVTPGEN